MARKRTSFFPRIQSFLKYGRLAVLSLIVVLLIVSIPIRTRASEDKLSVGQSLYERANYQEAVEVLEQAVSTFQAQADKVGMAIALSNLSLTYQQLGRWQQAERAVVRSLDLLATRTKQLDSESARIKAQALNVLARLQFERGQHHSALNTWQQATAISSQLEDEIGVIRTQINQAHALSSLGMYSQAEKILDRVVELLKPQPNSALKARALRSLGSVYRAMGNITLSRQTLKQSLSVAEATQTPTGDILLALGNTALASSQPQAALNFYQAVDNATINTRIQAQLNQLSLLETDRAIQLADKIESELADLPPSHTVIYAKINLAENLQRLSNDADIPDSKLIQILTQAQKQAEELNDTSAVSYALGNLGEIYAQTELQQAIATTQAALYWGATNDRNLTYRWQWQLGRLQQKAGKTAEAIAAYTEAVNNLQQLRNNLVAFDPKVQFSFRERVEPVYRELVDLLLQSQPDRADLILARQTIESLQLLELENFFRQACLEPKVDIDEIVNSDNSTAVIYPIILADRLEIIVKSAQSKLVHFTTPVSRDELESTTATLREDLLDVTKTTAVKQRSQQLYRWLIEPLETTLRENNIDTLVFVLDGSLRNIPMSVLYNQQQQQYLIEQYAIAIAPGLQLVRSQPFTPTKLNVLTAGISQARTIAGRDFSSLANVGQELQQIQATVAKGERLMNREFTRTNLQKQLDRTNFSTVHLATHGKFSSNPEQTFILTWDKLLKAQDIASLMRQYNLDREDAIELLVLSACETATGDRLATLGLAGIAVRAGVRSTLASLWFTDDRYSSEIMSGFYRELSQGKTKAKALQAAQIAVLKKEQRPYLWSSFILLGNWL